MLWRLQGIQSWGRLTFQRSMQKKGIVVIDRSETLQLIPNSALLFSRSPQIRREIGVYLNPATWAWYKVT